MNNEEKRNEIVKEALSWVRTPYAHMGRIKGVGTDCGQILIEVYKNCGIIEDFTTEYYPLDFNLHNNEESYFKYVMKYAHKVETPQNGDIALYKYGRLISHSGIITNVDTKEIVHAKLGTGVTLSRWDDEDLGSRLVGFWSVF